MIERIHGIQVSGRCFSSDTPFIFYPNANDRVSLVYGKNGSGKSTISEAFSGIANNSFSEGITASLINTQKQIVPLAESPQIFVFNEKYIDENVKIDDDGLGTIILFGGQVDLQSEIDAQASIISSLEVEYTDIQAEYDKYLNPQNPLSPAYHWARIIAMLKQSGGWAETDSKIKGNRRNSSVTDDIVTEICQMTVKATFADLQKQFQEADALLHKVSDISIAFPHSILSVTYESDFESTIISMLGAKIEEPILTPREQAILSAIQSGGQVTIENARKEFSNDSTTVCPYCYQEVNELYKRDLVASINKVLNKDVDQHKCDLRSIVFPAVECDLSEYESLDDDLVKAINKQTQKCQEIILRYKAFITEKERNVYTPIISANLGLVGEIEKLNGLLAQLEEKRVAFNVAVKQKSTLTKQLLLITKQLAHLQTEKTYRDYLKQIQAKSKLFDSLEKKQAGLREAREKMLALEQQKSNIGLAIGSINNALDYVFFSHGRLSIELKNNKYYLKSNGNDAKPKDISLGERNVIALCYFFTQIMANQDIAKLYTNKCLIVIDDPVSSFDFENKVGIISFLRYQANRILKGNPDSKLLIFSHDLETIFSLRKGITEICESLKGLANVTVPTFLMLELKNSVLHSLSKSHNEYNELLKKVYQYANGDTEVEGTTIGNAMRRVLEAFSTFNYRKNIEKVSCDKNVLAALGDHATYFENLMYRLVLHGESHYEEQIYSIQDGYNFYQYISESEKRTTAKNIMCFMYLLSPHHITSHLQTEANAITKIKQWVKAIPTNQSFEIIEFPIKRTIPLYELPISAGVGSQSFDGVPFTDYETDHPTCDFALRISGNSMEPRIKDGSIVLIKQSGVVEERKIGAFYYDGKVYCKYLAYKDGKTLLCSYNKAYEPICVTDDTAIHTYGEVVAVVEDSL